MVKFSTFTLIVAAFFFASCERIQEDNSLQKLFTPKTSSFSKEAEIYLREVLNIIKSNSLRSKNVDWKKVESEAFQLAAHAQKTSDTYPAINFILAQLKDGHSYLEEPLTKEKTVEKKKEVQFLFDRTKGEMLPNKIGYILLPTFTGQELETLKYAAHVNTLIKSLAQHNPCGWIIDLRQNTGGNMWPMLAGIGPLVGEGTLGFFVDSEGKGLNWSYKNGDFIIGEAISLSLPHGALRTMPDCPPVAVLIGPDTTSSGEAVAISFKNRPHTRFFGQKTAGLSTANQDFPLKDGAVLVLTVAVFADRSQNIYENGVIPDEVTFDEKGQEDNSLKQALQWLLNQAGCHIN
ncbi:MAG: S41 family peptidase [Proteobacteria bacterium]|nr:S41 family peptidase [Pseudomonadota bacterium]